MRNTEQYSTIKHLDSFFLECQNLGQGISGKDTITMRTAVEELIRTHGVGVVLDLKDELYSDTSQRNLRRALDNVHPNFSKMFA